jgi:sarcosine oxidase
MNPLLALEHGGGIRLPLTVERQTTHWFAPAPGTISLRAEVCPITMLEQADGQLLYTIPDVGHGVKAGIHHSGEFVDADSVDRTISAADEHDVRTRLDDWMPGAAYRSLDASVCLYTNTPDFHFLVDAHPTHGNVLLVSACSGHGFKFATALAEVAADLSLEGGAAFDVSVFGVARLLS